MANRTRVSMMAQRIGRKLQKLHPLVFRAQQLSEVLHEHGSGWRLPRSLTTDAFINGLIEEGELERAILDFGTESFECYLIPNVSVYHLASYGVPRAYLSHHSALDVWKLATQQGSLVYVNQEQSGAPSKAKKNELVQEAIDQAFLGMQRESKSRTAFREFNIILIKGKATGKLGIIEYGSAKRERAVLTDVERTLIDCAVRPSYAGGAKNVLQAFFLAKKKNMVSVAQLAEYLSQLDYVYPYHQCIGLYMQMAGNYSEEEMAMFETKRPAYDFYLEYGMEKTTYNERWRIHFPSALLH